MRAYLGVVVLVAASGCGGHGGSSVDASPDARSGLIGRAVSISIGAGLQFQMTSGVCAVLVDHTLWCWGDVRTNAIPAVPSVFTLPVQIGDAADWQSVQIGGHHGCGIRDPGTLWCWGRNQHGEVGNGTQDLVPEPIQIGTRSDWAEVAAGFASTCARTVSGEVWCWGNNNDGQLGNPSPTPRSSPELVRGLPGNGSMQSITAGAAHVCAIDPAFRLWCWGSSVYGATGTTASGDRPQVLPGTWTRVSANSENTAAIATDGTLYGWGENVGSSPVQLDARTGWTEVSATHPGACAIRSGGELWCRGYSVWGVTGPALGDNPTLTQIAPGSSFDTIDIAVDVGCANRDGRLACVGSGHAGQLGDLAERHDRSPHRIPGTWSAVSAADYTTCGIETAGATYCWGSRLVLSDTPDRRQVPTIVPLPAVSGLAHSSESGIEVTATGELWKWGAQFSSTGTTYVDRAVPLDTSSWSNALAAGSRYFAAIRADGSLWTWGSNDSSQLGDGTRTTRDAPVQIGTGYNTTRGSIAAGGLHTCAIDAAGGMHCWGSNLSGQLGDGTFTHRTTPSPSASGTWSQVTASEFWTLARRSDGTLWMWGDTGPRTGDTASPVQVVAGQWLDISAGGASCAVRSDHTLWCWGANYEGVTGTLAYSYEPVPVQLGTESDWALVTVGATHACAIKLDASLWCWGGNQHGERGDGLSWRTSYEPVAFP